MPDFASLQPLFDQYGLPVFLLLSVIEGPVVTVLAAALAGQGSFDIRSIFALAVLGDLIGDVVLYLCGRFAVELLPAHWRHRWGRGMALPRPAMQMFRQSGGQVLILAKLTHVAGLPTLLAAGAARMPFAQFLGWSIVATLPKTGVLCAAGYLSGSAIATLDPPVWVLLAGFTVFTLSLVLLSRRLEP